MGAGEDQPDVRPLVATADIARAVDLLAEIWGPPGPLSRELLRALGHAGGYTAGAWIDDELVGVSAGFLARHGDELLLHSHVTGVRPAVQGADVGYALKCHQRMWARERGLAAIEWTFDPLSRRNAYFNLRKLGARIVGFEPDFYGSMADAINTADDSDRAMARWDVQAAVLWSSIDENEASVVLEADQNGDPVVSQGETRLLRAWIPEDHVALRSADPGQARRWRLALRDTLGEAVP